MNSENSLHARFKVLDKYRISGGPFKTNAGDPFGAFFIPMRLGRPTLKVICSPFDDGEWQHVSVSLPKTTPSWEQMCVVKNLFWGEDETVIQFHPKKSEYVNNCGQCLHLWRKRFHEHELPPSILVGIKQ